MVMQQLFSCRSSNYVLYYYYITTTLCNQTDCDQIVLSSPPSFNFETRGQSSKMQDRQSFCLDLCPLNNSSKLPILIQSEKIEKFKNMISLSEVLPIHLTTMFICHKMKFQVVRSIVSVGGGVAGVTPSLGLIVHRENRFWCPVTMLPIKSCSSKSRNSTKTVEETGKKSAHYPWNLIFKFLVVLPGLFSDGLVTLPQKNWVLGF